MKKGLVSIAMLACVAFADNIINADGSINKESAEYKKANEECFNGCDYDDWTISQSLEYSLDGSGNGWRKSFDGNQLSEDKPLYIRLKSTIKTDHWEKSTQPSIPVVLKISAENGFKYFMTSQGNGNFAWLKNEREGVYQFHAIGAKNGKENISVLKLSSIKSGTVSIQVIYLNESLNRRYGNKYSIYVYPKK